MIQDPLMEVRTSLNTTTNTSGSLNAYGVEIDHRLQQVIADVINRGVDFKPLVNRIRVGQLTSHWNLRINLGSTSKFSVMSDGGAGTPYPSTKILLSATAIAYRADYEVSNLMLSGASSYYDALADEALVAADELKLGEEKMMICGSDTNAYGITSGFNGLLQLMRWHSSNGGDTEGTAANKMADTTTVFGTARADSTVGKALDVSYVIAGTAGSATGVLDIPHLDKAIVQSNKHGGKDHERIFFCSEERVMEINQLLQPQQRFAGTLMLEGGFSIQTYRGIPIIGSRYMDKNGATNTSSWNSSTDADNSMYLLDLTQMDMLVLDGVDAAHVLVSGEISGTAGYNRADTQGGFFKTYAVFRFKSFQSHVHIANLTAPA